MTAQVQLGEPLTQRVTTRTASVLGVGLYTSARRAGSSMRRPVGQTA